MIDIFVAAAGLCLAGYALVYGCQRVQPGSWLRWLVYLAGGVIATQFGWLPLLPMYGLRVTVDDQYMAVGLAALGLKLLMEKILPLAKDEVRE